MREGLKSPLRYLFVTLLRFLNKSNVSDYAQERFHIFLW